MRGALETSGNLFGYLWHEVHSGVSGLQSITNWDADWPEFPRLEAEGR